MTFVLVFDVIPPRLVAITNHKEDAFLHCFNTQNEYRRSF